MTLPAKIQSAKNNCRSGSDGNALLVDNRSLEAFMAEQYPKDGLNRRQFLEKSSAALAAASVIATTGTHRLAPPLASGTSNPP